MLIHFESLLINFVAVESSSLHFAEALQDSLAYKCSLDLYTHTVLTGPRSAVSNVSGYRCVSDCNSRGREFDPGPVPYFRGD